MREKNIHLLQTAILIAGCVLVVFFLILTPGPGNMVTWVNWANQANELGLAEDYRINHDTYPPLTLLILFFVGKISHWFNLWIYTTIKFTIALFLLLSFVITLWVTRNAFLSLIMMTALLINSVGLGHLDIFFAPVLILSLWSLKERRLVLFTITFCLSFLFKWQPLIIGPFIALYIIKIKNIKDWRDIEFGNIAKTVILPAAVILGLVFLSFGAKPVITAFIYGTDHHYLSGNALNMSWVLTHFLHVIKPETFGPLVNGQADLIKGPPDSIKILPRLLFMLFYVVTLVFFLKREKSFCNLLVYSLLGYWAYFTLNTGVHENHLFLGMLLAIMLFWVNKEYLIPMLLLILIGNFNLIVFNGIDGIENQFSRVFMGIDLALVISFFNIASFIIIWLIHALPKRHGFPK